MNVLNEQTVRLINTLSKHFCNDDQVYDININKGFIKIQGIYKPTLVAFLLGKNFTYEVNTVNGYLYLIKQVGLINVKFVLTD